MFKSSGQLAFLLMTVLFRVRDAMRPPETALRHIGVIQGGTVLDYGCGPGGYSLAAARLVGADGRVYAVDINPRAVRRLQQIADRSGITNIVAKVGRNPSSIPARSVDLAILHDVLHELEDPDLVISGLWRALKSEGILAVNDHHMGEDEILNGVTRNGAFDLVKRFDGTQCFQPRTGE